jgi:quercetin dioxygenase-like cupin family protein
LNQQRVSDEPRLLKLSTLRLLALQRGAEVLPTGCFGRGSAALHGKNVSGIDASRRALFHAACSEPDTIASMKLSSLLFLLIVSAALVAQNPGIQRTVLQRKDISMPGREAVIARVEIAAGASAGRHTHPGEEISYILDGEAEILVEGQAPLKVKAGDSFVIPNGAKHDAHNTGSVPMHLVGVYLVEKGKPLATPAP